MLFRLARAPVGLGIHSSFNESSESPDSKYDNVAGAARLSGAVPAERHCFRRDSSIPTRVTDDRDPAGDAASVQDNSIPPVVDGNRLGTARTPRRTRAPSQSSLSDRAVTLRRRRGPGPTLGPRAYRWVGHVA